MFGGLFLAAALLCLSSNVEARRLDSLYQFDQVYNLLQLEEYFQVKTATKLDESGRPVAPYIKLRPELKEKLQKQIAEAPNGELYRVEGRLIEDSDVQKLQQDYAYFGFQYDRQYSRRIVPILPGINPINHDGQYFFELDTDNYIGKFGGRTFLDAKKNNFRYLEFDRQNFQFFRPFFYMSEWLELGHPPLRKLERPLSYYWSDYQDVKELLADEEIAKHPYFDYRFQREIDRVSNTELSIGNELEMLHNSDAFWKKVDLVNRAEKQFLAAVLYFRCDETTMPLVKAIEAAVKRGVEVKFLAEKNFFIAEANCIRKLRRAGVQVMGGTDMLRASTFLSVMHNKLWIRDGVEGIVGGQNLLKAENYSDGFNGYNRDVDLYIKKGPLVTDITYQYAKLWNYFYGKNSFYRLFFHKVKNLRALERNFYNKLIDERLLNVRGVLNYRDWFRHPEKRMNGVCRVAVQNAGATEQSIGNIIMKLTEAAKKQVIFTTHAADFDITPDEKEAIKQNNQFYHLLVDKSKNQKDFKTWMITNSLNGGEGELTIIYRDLMMSAREKQHTLLEKMFSKMHFNANRGRAEKFQRQVEYLASQENFNVWNYFQYIHSKVYMWDNLVTSVGSFNADYFSFERSHESQVFCMDKSLSEQMARSMVHDMTNSFPTLPETIKPR